MSGCRGAPPPCPAAGAPPPITARRSENRVSPAGGHPSASARTPSLRGFRQRSGCPSCPLFFFFCIFSIKVKLPFQNGFMLTSLQYVECKVSLAVGPVGPRRAPHAPSGRRRARTYGSSVFPRVTLQRVRGAVSASATHAPVPTDLTAKRAPDRLPSASRHPSSPTGKDPPSWGARGPAARPHPLPACRAPAPAGPRRDVLTGSPSLPGAPSFPGGPGGPCGPGTSRASGPGTSGPVGSWEGRVQAGGHTHACLDARHCALRHPGLGSASRRDVQVDAQRRAGWAHGRVGPVTPCPGPRAACALARTPQARPPRAGHGGWRGRA